MAIRALIFDLDGILMKIERLKALSYWGGGCSLGRYVV
jgi:phosphoglycolate phosphatase-like HAD superfamily hydrolase